MPSQEERRESGRAYMVVGWVLVLFALLVVFFHPAALRIEHLRLSATAQLLNQRAGPWWKERNDKPFHAGVEE